MRDSQKAGVFLIALVITWVCFSVLIFNFTGSNSITGMSSYTLEDEVHVLIKPRGAHVSKIIRSMEGVEIEEYFGDDFTAEVNKDVLPQVLVLGDVFYLE